MAPVTVSLGYIPKGLYKKTVKNKTKQINKTPHKNKKCVHQVVFGKKKKNPPNLESVR